MEEAVKTLLKDCYELPGYCSFVKSDSHASKAMNSICYEIALLVDCKNYLPSKISETLLIKVKSFYAICKQKISNQGIH